MPAYMRDRFIFALILAVVCSISALLSQNGNVSASTAMAAFTGKVVAITDGDTIKVMHNGQAERIRLWGIDCPESHQTFGSRATRFTGDLAFGKVVTVHVKDIDRYHRTVGEVILPDGRSLNLELVKAGLAWWYAHFAKHDMRLAAAEAEARSARRGLWSDPNPVPPWEWRGRKTAAGVR